MNTTAKAVACVVSGMTLITLQDVTVKWLSASYPLYEIIFSRACVAILLILAIMALEGTLSTIRHGRVRWCIGRGCIMVAANVLFFLAVVAMPLAEAIAILFVSPLIVTLLSVPILGEKVGWQRWLAVCVGFAGVVVMLRPGSGLTGFASALPILAACAYSCVVLMTRRLGATEKASTMSFYLQACFVVAGVAAGVGFGDGRFAGSEDPSLRFLFRSWAWPTLFDLGLFAACGVLIGMGNFLMTQAYRIGEATMVAPFEYVALPMAVLWGYLLWHDLPDAVAVVGITLIAGSGLFVFYRETRHGRTVAADKPISRGR